MCTFENVWRWKAHHITYDSFRIREAHVIGSFSITNKYQLYYEKNIHYSQRVKSMWSNKILFEIQCWNMNYLNNHLSNSKIIQIKMHYIESQNNQFF